jgi:predicted transcriptional regulator
VLVRAPAATVREYTGLATVARLLVCDEVPAVAVVDASALVCGVITPRDLLAARPDWTAEDAMSAVLAVHANERIDTVADLMAREHVECVVVTDGDHRPLGFVCARELARRLLHRAA